MKPRDILEYILLALIWGSSFVVVLAVVRGFGWVGAVTFRALTAGLTLLALSALLRRPLDRSPGWRPFAIVGATTVAGQLIGISFSTPRIGTAMAAIFVATIPLFSMALGRLWALERLRPADRLGIGLGFVGIVLLFGFPTAAFTGSFLLGCAAALGGALSAAFGSNYASLRLREVPSWDVTTFSFLWGGAMTLPLLIAVPVPGLPDAFDVLMLLLLGTTMSALAYVLYFRLVGAIGPTRAISVEFAVTLVAVLIGALLLGEDLTLPQLVGAAIILAGCALVLGLVPQRRRD
jgi:drug/metabolite transporter (DMT)-like permease